MINLGRTMSAEKIPYKTVKKLCKRVFFCARGQYLTLHRRS